MKRIQPPHELAAKAEKRRLSNLDAARRSRARKATTEAGLRARVAALEAERSHGHASCRYTQLVDRIAELERELAQLRNTVAAASARDNLMQRSFAAGESAPALPLFALDDSVFYEHSLDDGMRELIDGCPS